MTLTHYEIFVLKEVHDRIKSTITEPLKINELIADTNLSPRTFIRAYKTVYGQTPAQHRLQLIMDYTKKRIAEGIPVKAVAREVGYSNQENFSRAFKKIFGYRPSKPQP